MTPSVGFLLCVASSLTSLHAAAGSQSGFGLHVLMPISLWLLWGSAAIIGRSADEADWRYYAHQAELRRLNRERSQYLKLLSRKPWIAGRGQA